MQKAQLALEYVIVTALAITILTPILLYATRTLDEYRQSNQLIMARNSVTKLGQAADWVFSQGQPAKLEVEIYIPEGIREINISDRFILFKVETYLGNSTFHYFTLGNINGSIPLSPGYIKVKVEATPIGVEVKV